MRKYSVVPKRIKNQISIIEDDIRFDDERRLRNALRALQGLDPSWQEWVTGNIQGDIPLQEKRKLLERQARSLSMKNYSFLGPGLIKSVIDSDYYFTDDGSLKTYL